MALITLLNAHLAFGHVPLLDGADFSLDLAERVGLIGRNGTGKSSLLRILGGLEQADDGVLQVQQGVRITYVAQEPVLDEAATVFATVSAGLAAVIALREQYEQTADPMRLILCKARLKRWMAGIGNSACLRRCNACACLLMR